MGGESYRMVQPSYNKLVKKPVGKKIHRIYEERLRQFTSDGQYKDQGLLAKLYDGKAAGSPHVKLWVYSPPNLERPLFKDATRHEFKPTNVGNLFGPSWSTHWFKIVLTVPEVLRHKDHLEFHWDANNEGLIYTEDGLPVQGLTGSGERTNWILPVTWKDGLEHTFYLEMACNGMFGNADSDTIQPPDPARYFKLRLAEIVAVNLETRALQMDFWIIGGKWNAAREFPENSWQEHSALTVCNNIMDCFIAGQGSHKCILDCRKIAKSYLGDKVDSSDVYSNDKDVLVTGIGYCHIDTAWLWPWAETKRKVARSWANQVDLLERYPEHRFCCSQAQQYKWLKTYYPKLFDRVKEKVKQGTFQPIGGSWVEHDTNLPGGESLVRQFLYGQRFFESNFGERSTTFWLPDTFGYSAQIPQLCRLAGMSRFLTQKLSWNNINNFPHTTFNWIALDGSQVLCHMPPAETYTAEANFGDVDRSMKQHKSMDQDPTSLLVFGKGDGGGGPTWEQLEKLRRCRGISDTAGLLPRVNMGGSADDFFAALQRKAESGTDFVTWYGELYFELHRGTYTTQARDKRNNRKAETLLHDIEYLATYASIQDLVKGSKDGYKYPKTDLDAMWEDVLLCHFHDCLPGSCIEMCYDDSAELYARVFALGEKLLANAMTALGFDSISSKGELVTINTRSVSRSEIDYDPSASDSTSYAHFTCSGPGICSYKPITSSFSHSASIKEISSDVHEMSNAHYIVRLHNGTVTSIYDRRADREVIPAGARAAQLVLYDDKPLYWQAWDVEVYHLDVRQELHAHRTYISERGSARVALTTEIRISEHSWIKTIIRLPAAVDEHPTPLTFDSEIEWREAKKFLKVEFPVDVHNTEAAYETQFGIVRRPTHYNTSWDMARFEVCCHRWADLSDAAYGVSVLNDCKYGFATQGNVMRLSLLRASKAPDGHADMGRHHVRYALLPHDGPLGAQTVRAATAFNNPISLRKPKHPLSVDSNGLSINEPVRTPTTSESSSDGDAETCKDPALRFDAPILPLMSRHASPSSIAPLLGSLRMSADSAPGLVLDTIKRGEDDANLSCGELAPRAGRSIVIRIYDALGGKCKGRLEFGVLLVKRARVCNLLEDDGEEMKIDKGAIRVELRAFEVLSVRLEL